MTGSHAWTVLAAIAFVGSHFVFSGTPLRAHLIARIGRGAFMALFSLVAAATLVWLVAAFNDAPYRALWTAGPGLRHVPLIVMPFASILLVAGLSTRNPMSAAGGHAGAGAPGILAITRHPVNWAVVLWAGAHLVVNGDLGALILFGALGVLGLGGSILQDAKKRRTMGADWAPFAHASAMVPFAAWIAGRTRPCWSEIGPWRILGGLAFYGVLIAGHEAVIGFSALPR